MSRLFGNRILATLLTGLAILTLCPIRASGPQFVPPHILTAGSILYPLNTATPGIVTLLLKLDATARVENIQVLRDIPPLTIAEQTAVQTWTFATATRDGNPASFGERCGPCVPLARACASCLTSQRTKSR